MNFTSDVKKEILPKRRGKFTQQESKAALVAFLATCGEIGYRDGIPTFFVVSETEMVAEFFTGLFFDTFGVELSLTTARMNVMSGRDKLVFECPLSESERVMRSLFLVDETGRLTGSIPESLVSGEAEQLAFVKGAFLGGGSCILPSEEGKTGYHLEFVFPEKETAERFCELLEVTEVIAKVVERKDTFVAYVKSKEMISDFLAAIGAKTSLKKFISLVERRDEANRKNRAANCISGNADKSALAAVKQVVAIKALKESGGFDELTEDLKALATLRLSEPSKSLQELAELLKVSKSCLNHRMRRLMELSLKITDKK